MKNQVPPQSTTQDQAPPKPAISYTTSAPPYLQSNNFTSLEDAVLSLETRFTRQLNLEYRVERLEAEFNTFCLIQYRDVERRAPLADRISDLHKRLNESTLVCTEVPRPRQNVRRNRRTQNLQDNQSCQTTSFRLPDLGIHCRSHLERVQLPRYRQRHRTQSNTSNWRHNSGRTQNHRLLDKPTRPCQRSTPQMSRTIRAHQSPRFAARVADLGAPQGGIRQCVRRPACQSRIRVSFPPQAAYNVNSNTRKRVYQTPGRYTVPRATRHSQDDRSTNQFGFPPVSW